MKHALWLALPLLLMAAQDAPPAPFALATLNVRQGGARDAEGVYRGGAYKLVDRLDVPAGHDPRDALIAFEGPGWESDKVAYRLYLDARNVPDIYGKKLPGPILPRIGQGKDDYHAMADWGQDIFQVDQSLGMGGIGVWRPAPVGVTQLGPSESIGATVVNRPGVAEVLVENHGFAGAGGPADLSTRYWIAAGSRITHVEARVGRAAPAMAAGLKVHRGTDLLYSREAAGAWRYIGTWGRQSLAGDELGIALFFPEGLARYAGVDKDNMVVRFCDAAKIRYAFAAAWIQEPGAPRTKAAFQDWLEATLVDLNGRFPIPLRAVPLQPGACGLPVPIEVRPMG